MDEQMDRWIGEWVDRWYMGVWVSSMKIVKTNIKYLYVPII